MDQLEVEANKCLKVRAVTSSCTACLDACPTNCIEIKLDSLELGANCLNCGLCTAVCPTNALKWNHPPLIQLQNQVLRLAEKEEAVYLTCAVNKDDHQANVLKVSCLGTIPTEFWISIGLNAKNCGIIYDPELCQNCHICTGEALFVKQHSEAEALLNEPFTLIPNSRNAHFKGVDEDIDHKRRRFLSSLFEEVKETNTITVKEVLEADKPLSPFEKFNRYYEEQQELAEIVDEVNEVKQTVIDRVIHDTVVHTDKRAILFTEFKRFPELQEQMTFLLPEIKESCTRCGACAFLCPTDALLLDDDRIFLSTTKCVSCNLCVEICYEKHIHLVSKKGTIFHNKFIELTEKSKEFV